MAIDRAPARASIAERFGRRSRSLAKSAAAGARSLSKRQIVAIAAVLGCIVLLSRAREMLNTDTVQSGVRVGATDVSGLRKQPLEEILAKQARELERRALSVRVAGKPISLDPKALGFRIDVAQTTDRVFSVGLRGGPLVRLFGVYKRWFAPDEVELAYALKADELSKLLERWEETAIFDRAFMGGIKIDGTKVEALAPRGGRKLDRAGAERAIRRALVAEKSGPIELPIVSVPAPFPPDAAEAPAREARALVSGPITLVSEDPEAHVVLSPNELSTLVSTVARPNNLKLVFVPENLEKVLAEARKAIERDAVDAKFEIDQKEKITIVPSRTGLRVDLPRFGAELLAAASRHDRTAELPLLHEPKPSLATEEAERLGIKGLVSSFTTRHPCCEKRVDNIHRIADILNGRVVRPGETASVNEIVGPRTVKNGFVLAPTIEEGEIVDSVGGGISQFATTFFNALFHGGYEIIERQPHTYWFPRYPMGHEATLSWPKPDIIFRNDTEAGMVFKTSYTGTSITVRIYGDNGGRKVRAEVSGRQNVIEPAVEILPNPRVPPDEEKVKEPGSVGWSVIVSRFVTYPDGAIRQDRRRVTYKPRPKRVEVHPCRVPKGEKGHTGERCPEPEDVEEIPSP